MQEAGIRRPAAAGERRCAAWSASPKKRAGLPQGKGRPGCAGKM